jgi:hypothetical protein
MRPEAQAIIAQALQVPQIRSYLAAQAPNEGYRKRDAQLFGRVCPPMVAGVMLTFVLCGVFCIFRVGEVKAYLPDGFAALNHQPQPGLRDDPSISIIMLFLCSVIIMIIACSVACYRRYSLFNTRCNTQTIEPTYDAILDATKTTPPAHLPLCQISYTLMMDPCRIERRDMAGEWTVIGTEAVYERSALLRWFKNSQLIPHTGEAFDSRFRIAPDKRTAAKTDNFMKKILSRLHPLWGLVC